MKKSMRKYPLKAMSQKLQNSVFQTMRDSDF